MDIDLNKLEIIQNTAESRFEVTIEGYPSRLEYVEDGDTIVMAHVGVHPALRGQGVAARLTQAGLDYARVHALRVIPMCSYVAAYIRRNPQYVELTKLRGRA